MIFQFLFEFFFIHRFIFMISESSGKSTKNTGVAKAIKEDPNKSVKMLSPSSVDNDPLADLLK